MQDLKCLFELNGKIEFYQFLIDLYIQQSQVLNILPLDFKSMIEEKLILNILFSYSYDSQCLYIQKSGLYSIFLDDNINIRDCSFQNEY